MTLKERVMNNLAEYKYINKYLGNTIKERLETRGYTRGMLTARLLYNEPSETDLVKLEHILQLGETHCADFKHIFEERKLPNKDIAIDGEIINTLAEVKAFEFLYEQDFSDITKIKRKKDTKTVDFTAKRNGQNYAVEVTRLGLAQTDRKKPKYMVQDRLPHHNILGIRQLEGEFFLISGKENIPRIGESIFDTIGNKYTQIREFCQAQSNHCKGILIISTGRDYFVMNKYARTEFEITPKAVEEALKKVWNLLIEEQGNLKYLHNVVITIGKDLKKAIIYPEL